MNRRTFLKSSAAFSAAASLASRTVAAPAGAIQSNNRGRAKIAAYYLNVHMYTCVPRHVRNDMEWMADKGTDFVCTGVLEQDLFAARENLAQIISEAERVRMRVLAVPSRWAGATAGAPKVPSLFSMTHLDTLVRDRNGSTVIGPHVSGAVSSVHHPDTLAFFRDTLAELYLQHPSLAGVIFDEPKNFLVDYSERAIAALGRDAPRRAHLAATTAFWGNLTAFAKEKWPDKMTVLFGQAHQDDELLDACSAISHLDYFGADGRPWGKTDDLKMRGEGADQESGKGKVLLDGPGHKVIALAHREQGRKAFLLVENHNLKASMMEPLERNLAAVLALPADLFAYYYYPRNVEEPDRSMEVIGRQIKQFTATPA